MASHSLSLSAAAQILPNTQILKFDSKLLLWPSRLHTKPTTKLSSSIRAMGSSASSNSNNPNTTEIQSGIHYFIGFSSLSFFFAEINLFPCQKYIVLLIDYFNIRFQHNLRLNILIETNWYLYW